MNLPPIPPTPSQLTWKFDPTLILRKRKPISQYLDVSLNPLTPQPTPSAFPHFSLPARPSVWNPSTACPAAFPTTKQPVKHSNGHKELPRGLKVHHSLPLPSPALHYPPSFILLPPTKQRKYRVFIATDSFIDSDSRDLKDQVLLFTHQTLTPTSRPIELHQTNSRAF